jgi:hypothetical protein
VKILFTFSNSKRRRLRTIARLVGFFRFFCITLTAPVVIVAVSS